MRRLTALGTHLPPTPPSALAGLSAPEPAAAGGLPTASQIEDYCRDGFVVVSGLVAAPIVAAAVDAMWQQMEGPPKSLEDDPWARDTRSRPRRSDRATWGGSWAGIVDGPSICATFTPELLAVAETLANAYEAASPFPSVSHPIAAPPQTLAINIFPAQDAGAEWKWPDPHTDGGGKHTTPRACRIQHMTYLTSSGEHGGGGTVAWPGSSRGLESLYVSDAEKYARYEDLSKEVPEVCKAIQPVEVTPQAGDVRATRAPGATCNPSLFPFWYACSFSHTLPATTHRCSSSTR